MVNDNIVSNEDIMSDEEIFGKKEEVLADTKEEESQPVEEPYAYQFKTDDELHGHKFKYTTKAGKEVEEDFKTILERAGWGYNSAQVNAEAKRLQEESEQRMKSAQELEGKWSQYDKYAQENPEWYDHWQRAWDNRTLRPDAVGFDPAEQANTDARVERLLQEKLSPIQEKIQRYEEWEQNQKIEQEDQQLSNEVNTVRKQYSDIDFDHADPQTGESLEYQVLKYQHQNGIKSFDAAFKAFYHPQLIKREVERAENAKLEAERAKVKQGIVSETRGSPGQQKSIDHRRYTMDQLGEMALKELTANK